MTERFEAILSAIMAKMRVLRQENQTLRQENLKLREENQALREENLRLSNELAVALQRIQQQDELISTLRDEIAELKGTPKRPRLPPSNLEGPKQPGQHRRQEEQARTWQTSTQEEKKEARDSRHNEGCPSQPP